MDGVMVTGTGSGVGKTVVAAALLKGRPDAVFVKPVQTGLSSRRADVDIVAELTGVGVRKGQELAEQLPSALAARRAGIRLDRARLLAPFRGLPLVVGEGSGGLLEELGTDGTTVADLAVDLNLPMVITTRAGRDSLSHTSLALEACWARGLRVLGLVVTDPSAAPSLATNTILTELRRLAPVLGVIPHLEDLMPESLPTVRW